MTFSEERPISDEELSRMKFYSILMGVVLTLAFSVYWTISQMRALQPTEPDEQDEGEAKSEIDQGTSAVYTPALAAARALGKSCPPRPQDSPPSVTTIIDFRPSRPVSHPV